MSRYGYTALYSSIKGNTVFAEETPGGRSLTGNSASEHDVKSINYPLTYLRRYFRDQGLADDGCK
jgi:hypothetical protein